MAGIGTEAGRAPTLRDVAKLAGVHPSTASRALSGARTVRPEIASSVRRAARSLGYQVDYIGRALRARTTGTMGMVVPDIDNPFFPALVQAVERALHGRDTGLLLCDAGDDPAIEAGRLATLTQRRVDGILLSPVDRQRSKAILRRIARSVPVVQIDRAVDGSDVPADVVGVDQDGAIGLVVEHLERLGRRRFAFLASDPSVSTAADRLAAYRRRMADRPDALARIQVGDLSVRWGGEAAARLLDEAASDGGSRPDALICANDLIALGALQRLRASGVRVPQDIAVTGIDDTPFARIAEPPLTTVRQPLQQLADEAVALVVARASDRGRPIRRVILAPELVVRASTDPGIDPLTTLA